MSAVEDRLAAIIAEQMRIDGWTCEYHEPTSREGECSGCDESLTRTARAAAAVIASSADLAVLFEDSTLERLNQRLAEFKVGTCDCGRVEVHPGAAVTSAGDPTRSGVVHHVGRPCCWFEEGVSDR